MMNGGGASFPSGESVRLRNGSHPPTAVHPPLPPGNHHRSNRVRFPDEPISSESHPRHPGGSSSYDAHFFQRGDENESIWDVLIGLFVFFLTTVCVVGCITLLVILYLTVRPLSVNVYRRLSAHMCTATFLDAMALLLPNTRLIVTGDSDIPTPVGASVLVCNHLLDGEWWALLMLGRCVGFRGTMKGFLRNEFLQINLDDVDQSIRQQPSPTSASSQMNNRVSTNAALTVTGQSTSRMLAGSQQSSIPNNPSNSTCPNASLLPQQKPPPSPSTSDITLAAKLLHLFLEFPLLNGEDSGSPDREKLFSLLRSFAADNAAATAPVHLIFFPEAWSIHNNSCMHHSSSGGANAATSTDRRSIHAKSNEFAKREGKPQLKCLLQPRTRIFNASLECLRESNPLVYDVTLVSLTEFLNQITSLPKNRKLIFCFFRLTADTMAHFHRPYNHFRLRLFSLESYGGSFRRKCTFG